MLNLFNRARDSTFAFIDRLRLNRFVFSQLHLVRTIAEKLITFFGRDFSHAFRNISTWNFERILPADRAADYGGLALATSNLQSLYEALDHIAPEHVMVYNKPFFCDYCRGSAEKELHYSTYHHKANLEDQFVPNFHLWLEVMTGAQPEYFRHLLIHNGPVPCTRMPAAWSEIELKAKKCDKTKSRSYVYFLVDPTTLPSRESTSDRPSFLQFIFSIIYVGRGTCRRVERKVKGKMVEEWRPTRPFDHVLEARNPENVKVKHKWIRAVGEENVEHFLICRNIPVYMAQVVEDCVIRLLIARDLILSNEAQGDNAAAGVLTYHDRLQFGTQILYRAFEQFRSQTPPPRTLADQFKSSLEDDTWKADWNMP